MQKLIFKIIAVFALKQNRFLLSLIHVQSNVSPHPPGSSNPLVHYTVQALDVREREREAFRREEMFQDEKGETTMYTITAWLPCLFSHNSTWKPHWCSNTKTILSQLSAITISQFSLGVVFALSLHFSLSLPVSPLVCACYCTGDIRKLIHIS